MEGSRHNETDCNSLKYNGLYPIKLELIPNVLPLAEIRAVRVILVLNSFFQINKR